MKRQLDTTQKLYTLCMLVQDVPGVLSQVARLFSRKGYNIESIVSGHTDKPGVTRITIAIMADQGMLEQIAAQCSKLIPVISVKILDESVSIRREVALIKVDAADHAKRNEIIQLANVFRAKVIDVAKTSLTLEVFGPGDTANAQVTRGGADVSAFDPHTLASLRYPGLYAVGEALDIDGRCGGYNLHWAFASGLAAGRSAAE